ncbi:MAG: glycosyltransferase family 2 protein [Alphaproteobacteria bacterium]|nr:glycosyltransferase family 2 protein [Alphaproteobacteria bacterium]
MPPSNAPVVNLVMPMAGRGSRFAAKGYTCPKPLIPLAGKPFFEWAYRSVANSFRIAEFVPVILEEHAANHGLDKALLETAPGASVVQLKTVTSGALETALAGIRRIENDAPIIVNDCDHAFDAGKLAQKTAEQAEALPAGILSHFLATDPVYSFAEYDADGQLLRTAEKVAISNLAIAGCYWFKNKETVLAYAGRYVQNCPYNELFVSGLYNAMREGGEKVQGVILDKHLSFGTVSEYEAAQKVLAQNPDWGKPSLHSSPSWE